MTFCKAVDKSSWGRVCYLKGTRPLCVVEFADTGLDVPEYKAKLAMFNAWHQAQCDRNQEMHLGMTAHNATIITGAWDRYQRERADEVDEQIESKGTA
jgi:hypothetical protein